MANPNLTPPAFLHFIFFFFFSFFCFVCLSSSSGFAAVLVSKDGYGEYASISDAIAASPSSSSEKHIIHVEAGIYEEQVIIPEDKTNIVLVGRGRYATRIVGSRFVSDTSMDQSATVVILGSGFVGRDIGFVNTAGSDAGPGVALLNKAQNTAFYRCSFEGYQDTLWAAMGRQFYRDCEIYGTVDFVMGDATAVFQNSKLYARPTEFVAYTAQSRASKDEQTGFVFQFCKFTISPKDAGGRSTVIRASLGRPWRAYSRVVIMESYIDSIVDPKGWEVMYGSVRTDKLSYIEFANEGPGARTDGRVKWPGVRVVYDQNEVEGFTASRFLDGDNWIPETGIPYHPGL